MYGYSCKECGASVEIRLDGERLYSCEHRGTVIASMKATARGVGSVVPVSEKFVRVLNELVRRLRGFA